MCPLQPEAELRPDCVHVYGCDLLSTKEIMAYFDGYSPVFVEWINDSAANVVFADAFTAKRAMAGLGQLSADPTGQAQAQGAEPSPPAAEDRMWYRSSAVSKRGDSFPLHFRLATMLDVKVGRVKSRHLWEDDGLGRRRGGGEAGGKRKRHQGTRPEESHAGDDLRAKLHKDAELSEARAPPAAPMEPPPPGVDLRKAVLAPAAVTKPRSKLFGYADDD